MDVARVWLRLRTAEPYRQVAYTRNGGPVKRLSGPMPEVQYIDGVITLLGHMDLDAVSCVVTVAGAPRPQLVIQLASSGITVHDSVEAGESVTTKLAAMLKGHGDHSLLFKQEGADGSSGKPYEVVIDCLNYEELFQQAKLNKQAKTKQAADKKRRLSACQSTGGGSSGGKPQTFK